MDSAPSALERALNDLDRMSLRVAHLHDAIVTRDADEARRLARELGFACPSSAHAAIDELTRREP